MLPKLLSARLRRVRAIGIRLAAERAGRAHLQAFRDALLDRSAAERAEARRVIEGVEPMDFAAFYRERLHADHPALPHVIGGIRQTGDAEDAALVLGFVDHPRPRVRAAALRALDRFAAEGVEDFLLLAIADPNRGVSITAAKLLRPHVGKVAPGELGALVTPDLAPWARRNALSLLALRGKWIALPWLIGATSDPDDTVAVHASVLLRRWRDRFNRSFTQPTPEQRAEALAALPRYEDRAPTRRSWYWDAAHPPMPEWLRYILTTGG
jgi:HEAT repeat protein